MRLLNLNANSHFSVNPVDLDIGRSRFERPKRHLFTADVGRLIPCYWSEILPGDTVSMKVSEVFRQSTLLDPVFDTLYADINFFFVPMRLTWNHTKEFFGENTQGPWAPSVTYTIPQITFDSGWASSSRVGTVADYMGVPLGVSGISVSALPFRAYARVYDDWWRDENLITPPVIPMGDTNQTVSVSNPATGGITYKVSKFRDYLTSCLPGPQRGSAVSIPLTGSATVDLSGTVGKVTGAGLMHSSENPLMFATTNTTTNANFGRTNFVNNIANVNVGATSSTDNQLLLYNNLVVDWPSSATLDLSGVSPVTVNDLRMAFQMQKWLEKSALFGGRYISMLKAQFGVTSPDARLQRSEYLGGKRIPLNVTEVENTNGTTGTGSKPLGALGAYSHTSDSDDYFTHSFTEHGFLIGTVCFRYKHSYSQAINRQFSRRTMWDYYFPVMANLGNMAVLRKEAYADGTAADDDVFGYQEAWAEYRYDQDQISGFFRPGISGSLSSWHYGDYYTSGPTLSAAWIEEDKAPVDRTLAVPSSSTVPQLLCDMFFNPVFVRAMPLYSIPGLIDHH